MSQDTQSSPQPTPEVYTAGPFIYTLLLGGLLASPLLLLPTYLTTRRFSALHRSIGELNRSLSILRTELDLVEQRRNMEIANVVRLVGQDVRGVVDVPRREIKELSDLMEDEAADLRDRLMTLQSDLETVRDRERNSPHTAHWQSLSSSLADMARFIEEVELRQGWDNQNDHRGVDRMRGVAKQFEGLASANAQSTNPSPNECPK